MSFYFCKWIVFCCTAVPSFWLSVPLLKEVGCGYFLVAMNRSVMSVHIEVFPSTCFWFAGSGDFVLNLLRKCEIVFHSGCVLRSTQQCTDAVDVSLHGHSVVLCCGSAFCFSTAQWNFLMHATPHVLLGYMYIFFGKWLHFQYLQFKNIFLVLGSEEFVCIWDIKYPKHKEHYVLLKFSTFCGFSFQVKCVLWYIKSPKMWVLGGSYHSCR